MIYMAMDGAKILALVDTGEGNYVAIGQQTGLSWETTTNLIEVSHKGDNHEKYIPGKIGDTVSLDAFYVPNDSAYQAVKQAQLDGEIVKLRRSEDGTEVEEADAWVESVSGDAPDNDGATVSISFTLNTSWTTVA